MSDATPAAGAPTVLLVQGASLAVPARAGVIEAQQHRKVQGQGPSHALGRASLPTQTVPPARLRTPRADVRGRPPLRRRGDHQCGPKANHLVRLVHVAAFAPEERETVGISSLAPTPAGLLRQADYPSGSLRRRWELSSTPRFLTAWTDKLGVPRQALWLRDVFDRIHGRGR
jgi:hypothetical protein